MDEIQECKHGGVISQCRKSCLFVVVENIGGEGEVDNLHVWRLVLVVAYGVWMCRNAKNISYGFSFNLEVEG